METNHPAQPPSLRRQLMVVRGANWASRHNPIQHLSRTRFASLLGWALALAIVLGTLSPNAWGEQPAEDFKSRIMHLLSQLHAADPQTAEAAKAELKKLGLRDEDILVGWKLRHPDPAIRKALAQELLKTGTAQHADLVLELSKDQDQQVRLAALEVIRAMPANLALQERVRQIAGSDGDPVVRGNARLLAAEIKAGVSTLHPEIPPAEANSTPSAIGVPGEFPAGSMPADNPFAQPNGGSSAANFGALPGEAATPASGGFSSPHRDAGLPVVKTKTVFDPVQPFWNQHAAPEGTPNETASREPSGPVGSFWEKIPADEELIRQTAGLLDPLNPEVLNRPLRDPFAEDQVPMLDPIFQETGQYMQTEVEPPNGFSGPSSVLPREEQTSSHFVPVEDRWRLGYPEWDRYGRGHPWVDDYPFVKGHWWDPYNQNVLKGDYPIIGQHTFLNLTLQEQFIQNFQKNPIGTTPFESTANAGEENFFGRSRNFLNLNYVSMQVDLFHGSTQAFKPADWQVRLQPIFNRNVVQFQELANVNPDVRKGTNRTRTDFALEQYFVEAKIADLGPDFDFASIRAGSQPFNSDFRGFIFNDINRGVRLFGTQFGNRDQFNLSYFRQQEKDTNSLLNTFADRHQNVLIANYFRQDFLFPGYTAELSYHYNDDGPSTRFDRNNFLVRPDPVGVFQPHRVQAHYFGINGDGHIGRINVTNSFYWVTGKDSRNPLANQQQNINAKMAAVELSLDRDWVRFRTSYFYASGDSDINDNTARGFDTILDNPNFAGGQFSYWQRQAVRLFGVNLVQNGSLIPNLRSSKIQGQSNFVNPGLHLVNAGMDFDVTPKMKVITNANYMWFDTTRALEVFTFQDNIDPEIGLDLSLGVEYRPFLNQNVIITSGLAMLVPGKGFNDLFGTTNTGVAFGGDARIRAKRLYSNFIQVILQF